MKQGRRSDPESHRNNLAVQQPGCSVGPHLVLLFGMDMELAQRMLDVVASIPAGKVATYGDIAARAGSRSPRLAGFVLAQLADEDTPWHRVLRADGTPAPHLADEQLQRLRAEDVRVLDGKVDLKRFRITT